MVGALIFAAAACGPLSTSDRAGDPPVGAVDSETRLIALVTSPQMQPPADAGEVILLQGNGDPITKSTTIHPHVALNDNGEELYIAQGSLDGLSGTLSAIRADTGETLRSATVQPPWGLTSGLVAPALFSVSSEGVLVYGHFVREPDPGPAGQTRNAFALSLLDLQSFDVLDTFVPSRCADGRLSGRPINNTIAIACPEDASIIVIPFTSSEFTEASSVRSPSAAPILDAVAALSLSGTPEGAQLDTARSAPAFRAALPGSTYHDFDVRQDGRIYAATARVRLRYRAVKRLLLVDPRTGAVTARSSKDLDALSFAYDHYSDVVYVVKRNSDNVLVLDGETLQTRKTLSADTAPSPPRYVAVREF